MNKETGGSAFPALEFQRPLKAGESVYESSGMTLRDYFAAKAMQGIMAGRFPIMSEPDAEHQAAKAAYIQADAMLKARKQ